MAIVGTFAYEEDFLAAAKNLKSSGFDDISLLSPIPHACSNDRPGDSPGEAFFTQL